MRNRATAQSNGWKQDSRLKARRSRREKPWLSISFTLPAHHAIPEARRPAGFRRVEKHTQYIPKRFQRMDGNDALVRAGSALVVWDANPGLEERLPGDMDVPHVGTRKRARTEKRCQEVASRDAHSKLGCECESAPRKAPLRRSGTRRVRIKAGCRAAGFDKDCRSRRFFFRRSPIRVALFLSQAARYPATPSRLAFEVARQTTRMFSWAKVVGFAG